MSEELSKAAIALALKAKKLAQQGIEAPALPDRIQAIADIADVASKVLGFDAGSEPVALPPYVGLQAIYIPAAAMLSRSTNGAEAATTELSSNKVMLSSLNFDATTQEYAQFDLVMPKSWNEDTLTFWFWWSHAATTTNFGVRWGIQARALANDEAQDQAFGTAVECTDEGGTTDDLWRSPATDAVTVAAAGDQKLVRFQIYRLPSHAGDTMAVDARLHGITMFLTTDSGVDS